MKYKKKKFSYKKSSVLNQRKPAGWEYGRAISIEIVNRSEFKKDKLSTVFEFNNKNSGL